ncbi:MAG TPA: DUF983 domain-containing protein [Alphaproteobacteria bacterium]|nr:DUF983 domain-containing protein [Alphaproteobacteria bacterium]
MDTFSPASVPPPDADIARRSLWPALRRGLRHRCPACGDGRLFTSYLKLQAPCPSCGLDTARYRADDAPAYFTIAIVGHIVVPLLLMMEKMYQPSTALQLGVAIPLTLGLTLSILPRIKGALVATNWATEAGG